MNKNVFINCPFDDLYENLFDAILFTVYFCGCNPRCALETDDGSQIRVEKIFSIIKDCDLGVHDISRTDLNINHLPRFNMPFEFGIFMGAKKFGHMETHHNIQSVKGFALVRPLSNSSFLSLKRINNIPQNNFSIFGCIYRGIIKKGNTPKITEFKGIGNNSFGEVINAIVISS